MKRSIVSAVALASLWPLTVSTAARPATMAAPVDAWCSSGTRLQAAQVTLYPTEHAPGAVGSADLVLVPSPFDLPVTRDGRYVYRVRFRVERVPVSSSRSAVAWVSTPELDEVQKVGSIDAAGEAAGTVSWNKFMLFVTEEDSPEVERWSGPVLLRGVSPSGKMQSFMGHSVFGPESC